MKKDYRIGLVGFFGWGNFGDELFIEAHRAHLSHLGTLEPINDITRKPYFSDPIEEVIDRYDAFVIGGGDLIVPWTVSELYWKEEYLGKPVFITGVGVPTWRDPQAKAMQTYSQFFQSGSIRAISARDERSKNWIDQRLHPAIPTTWHPDLCCALDFPAVEHSDVDAPILGVVLRKRGANKDDLSHVRALCERAKQLGYCVRHIVLGSKGVGKADLAIAEEFAEPDEEIRSSEDIWQLCREIGQCTALASMKFHGTVVATMYGIPSIVMVPTDKNRNFLDMIDRADLKCPFSNPDLSSKLTGSPVGIPLAMRESLRDGAKLGYAQLEAAICEALG